MKPGAEVEHRTYLFELRGRLERIVDGQAEVRLTKGRLVVAPLAHWQGLDFFVSIVDEYVEERKHKLRQKREKNKEPES